MVKISLTILIISLIGCTHCSVTKTNFNGKTHGLNPYGVGDAQVERESYWGSKDCVMGLMKETVNGT